MAGLIFPFFSRFPSRPLIGGAGIAGKPERSRNGTKRESRESNKPSFSGTKRYRSRVDRSAWRDSVHLPGIND